MPDFKLEDCISSNSEIEGKHCPPAFQIRKTEDSVTFYKKDYKTVFDVRKFPVISQVINIDKDLRAKLQIIGIPLPLLKWFVEGRSAKLVKILILDYFLIYLSYEGENIHSEFINNFEGDSITASHRDNLPVLYKYGVMLFC